MPSLQKLRYSKKPGQEWQPEVQSPMEKESLLACLDSGNIETLLITADLLREDDDWIRFVDALDDIGARFVQCSSDHDAGQQLIGMGGAVAYLGTQVGVKCVYLISKILALISALK